MDVVLKNIKEIEKLSLSDEVIASAEKAIKYDFFCVRTINDDGSVLLYGMEEGDAALPGEVILQRQFYKRKTEAFSDDGKTFDKELSIYEQNDRMIISFSGTDFELDLFLEDYKAGKVANVCIDAAGRNHGSDSVWIKGEDVHEAIDHYVKNYVEKKEYSPIITKKTTGTLRIPTNYIFSYDLVMDNYKDPDVENDLNPEETIAQGWIDVKCTVFMNDENCVIAYESETGKFMRARDSDNLTEVGEVVSLFNEKPSQSKWAWKMQWCKERGVPPANEEMWNKAEEEYNKKIYAEPIRIESLLEEDKKLEAEIKASFRQ